MVLIIIFIQELESIEKTLKSCFAQKYKTIKCIFICTEDVFYDIKKIYPEYICLKKKNIFIDNLIDALSYIACDYFTWIYAGDMFFDHTINMLVDEFKRDDNKDMIVAHSASIEKNGIKLAADLLPIENRNVFSLYISCFLIKKTYMKKVLIHSSEVPAVFFNEILKNKHIKVLNEVLLTVSIKNTILRKNIRAYSDVVLIAAILSRDDFKILLKKVIIQYFPQIKSLKTYMTDILKKIWYWRSFKLDFFCKKKKIELVSKREKMNVKIGMAVLIHERPELLELCLDSLFNTNLYEYDITFLLHDDGSQDLLVKEIINKKRAGKYKIVKSFTNKGHNSWGAAFNTAMHKLLEIDDFDIVGSCDSDVLFHPDWLDKTMKICLWAKENHKNDILGPFSSFNSSDRVFHECIGNYRSPYGNYIVKKRMGAVNYFYFREDFLRLGYFAESKDDETLMTEKFDAMGVRNFCTEESFVEHIGDYSILNKWRPQSARCVRALNLIAEGWNISSEKPGGFPFLKLNKTLVLEMDKGTMFDHLSYSHIPRIAKESGKYNKVYISSQSKVISADLMTFIWGDNPYVDGFCQEGGIYAELSETDFIGKKDNFLDQIMVVLGLDDFKKYHEPEIYFKPQKLDFLAGKTIYDPNCFGNIGKDLSPKTIHQIVDGMNWKIDYNIQIKKQFVLPREAYKNIRPESLAEYANILYSGRRVICISNETAFLCAALKKSACVILDKKMIAEYYRLPSIEYIVI